MNDFVEIPASKSSITKRKLICGIGVNDANYIIFPYVNGTRTMCPYYGSWKSMIGRCYDKKLHQRNPTYNDCTVCSEWLVFSVFKKWMMLQDWENKQLDKDIIIPNNKIYSPETCVFITKQINSLLNNQKIRRGRYPQGVSFDRIRNLFLVQCSYDGINKNLGRFSTLSEAELTYKKAKSKHITNIANKQADLRLKNGLLEHAKLIINN